MEGREEQTAVGVRQREAGLLSRLSPQVLLGMRDPVNYTRCVHTGIWVRRAKHPAVYCVKGISPKSLIRTLA